MNGWQNWSGRVACPDARLERPQDEPDLQTLIGKLAAGERLRAVGSGHSFMPFWLPGDRLVALDAFSGLERMTGPQGEVAVLGAGTPIHAIGPLLAAQGRALANQGDIDRQTLAGAVATGTHGTGRGLGSLSSMVASITLIDGTGTCRDIEAGDELEAARVSLGLLGVMTRIGIRTLPLYGLHERNQVESVEDCLAAFEARIEAHRHHEFWWVPSEDRCIAKTLDAIEVPTTPQLDDIPFGADGERWGASWQVFPSDRDLRFNELEFAVPSEAGPACFSALRSALLEHFPTLPWPIEYRIVAGDPGWLSPTAGTEVAAISVHQDARRDPMPLFELAEPILLDHGGRPHWGKMHSLDAGRLAALYPRLGEFAALRRTFDPDEHLLGDWLRTLLPC